MSRRTRDDEESLETLHYRVSCNLALLIYFFQAEQLAERGGTDHPLEQSAWFAVEGLLNDARDGLDRLNEENDRLTKQADSAKAGAR